MLQQFCTGQQLYSFASIRASISFSPQHFDLPELINHNHFVIQVVNHKLTITIVDKKNASDTALKNHPQFITEYKQ